MKKRRAKYKLSGLSKAYPQPDSVAYDWRIRFIALILILLTLFLLWRVVSLTVLNQNFLREQGDVRTLRNVEIPAHRGIIYDRTGEILAISTPVQSVWINPQVFNPDQQQLDQLAKLLQLSLASMAEQIVKSQSRQFMYLKRQVQPVIAEQIVDLNITGLYTQQEYKRFYPEAEVTSHVIGFTNIDDIGQEGFELAYDTWLSGVPGIKRVRKDLRGRVVAELDDVRAPRPGKSLELSLDIRIQYIAHKALQKAIEEAQAKSGTIVVLDTVSNEVLGMVNWPTYNPNNRALADSDSFRNRALTDLFEPGSTMKAFSVLNAVENGDYDRDTPVRTSPGWMRLGRHYVRDPYDLGTLSFTQVLQRSSNMGISRVTLSLAPESLWYTYDKLGFGHSANTYFPGERAGVLTYRDEWPEIALATMSFGYGLSVTALQLARAYSVLANYGVKKPVSMLKLEQAPEGEQVFSTQATQEVLAMLEKVVAERGATRARVAGYRAGGKTGTSFLLGENGYDSTKRVASFSGIAPLSTPRLVVSVIIYEPGVSGIQGSLAAAPVFSEVMGESLRILNIPPDA